MKPGSEIHNFREKELDYVRPELSHLNESWVGDSISHRLESAKQRYFDTVGQKMQTKAAPIREGVIVIKQETTMQELQQFAAVCKERFGIEAFQIHIHKDEGYMNAKQWTPNLHAHVVFDWTQPNGKSVRLSRDDMAELQTIASEALGMERGVSSDRKHLSAMQYKTECAKEQLQELSNDISSALDKHKDVQNQLLQLQKELRSIETKKNVQKLISKASEKFYGLIGKTVNDREKDALKAKIKALEGENEQLSDRLGKAILEKERNGTKVFKAENDKEYYRQQMDNARTTSNRLRTENQELKTETKELKKELGKMKDLFNSEQLEALRHHFPNISKAMEEGKDLLKQITRSRGFGMGMYPPPAPKGGATKRQLHSMECYAVRVRKKFSRVLCKDMMDVGKGLAGLGALFYVAVRIWQSMARAEPIDVYPLLRPFAIGICILLFPTLVLGTLNTVLSPIVQGTHKMLEGQTLDMERYRAQKEELEKEAMLRNPETAYLVSDEEFDRQLDELGWSTVDTASRLGMYVEVGMYNLEKKIRDTFRSLLELIFAAASLLIDTVRTFFLVVLSILGPVAFAFSVWDGFQSTLGQWFTRYISVYLWLPVSDLFSTLLAKLQVLMLQNDIQELQNNPDYSIDNSNSVYIIFMLIGIIGYFTVPTVAGWIVQAGGAGNFSRNLNRTATKTGSFAVGVGGAVLGNIGGRLRGK